MCWLFLCHTLTLYRLLFRISLSLYPVPCFATCCACMTYSALSTSPRRSSTACSTTLSTARCRRSATSRTPSSTKTSPPTAAMIKPTICKRRHSNYVATRHVARTTPLRDAASTRKHCCVKRAARATLITQRTRGYYKLVPLRRFVISLAEALRSDR